MRGEGCICHREGAYGKKWRGDDFSGCGASGLDGRRGETLMAIAELLGWGQRTCAEALVGTKSARGRAAASVTRGVGSRDAISCGAKAGRGSFGGDAWGWMRTKLSGRRVGDGIW